MKLKPYLILVSLCLLFACNKDAPIVYDTCPMVVETCISIPSYKGPGTGFRYVMSDSFSYDRPSINPYNPNEIVFFLYNDGYKGIFTYNMLTKKKTQLTSGSINSAAPPSQAKWGRNGWIIFGEHDYNIYKIKPNGDSLTKLTKTGRNYTPDWNYDGTMFCARYLNNRNNLYTAFYDAQGNIIDSIQELNTNKSLFYDQVDWQNKRYVLGTQNQNFILFDYAKKETINILNTYGLSVGFPRWAGESDIIFSGQEGIYTMNIYNRKVKKIRETCSGKNYSDVIVLDNNKLLCSGYTTNIIDTFQEILAYKTNIYILNRCDTNSIELDLR
jgi:hypothetical protein